jgi:hypothetical protein
VDKATAADEHFRLGQTVRVVDHNGRVRSFRLVGTIDLGVNHEFGNSTVTIFQTATGFSVTGRPGYDQVVARAAPGISQAALTASIRALPGMSGYQVQTGAQLATAEANSAAQFTQQFTPSSWSSRSSPLSSPASSSTTRSRSWSPSGGGNWRCSAASERRAGRCSGRCCLSP